MGSLQEVTRLKEEGNALFVQKDFVPAILKYSEAITLDGNNAVLYANRSACRYSLKQSVCSVLRCFLQADHNFRYLDAKSDALKVIYAWLSRTVLHS
jgi:stress-induced-phosphoprotein 1